jgi:general secretion pathway protein N
VTRRGRFWLILAGIAAAILFLPLRFALAIAGPDDERIAARAAGGTIWDGRLEQVRAGALDLGSFDVALRPLPLFLGRASIAIDRPAKAADRGLTGIVESGIGRTAIRSMTGSIMGGMIDSLMIDRVDLADATVVFADGACREAAGQVTLVPALNLAGLGLANGLTGPLSCDGRQLAMTLAGQSGMERLVMTVDAEGNYVARLHIRATDPMLGAALSAVGFGPTAEGFTRTMRGRL